MTGRLALVALLALPLLGGCIVGGARIQDEVDALVWDLRPLEVETQTELRIGRSVIGLAGMIARWADDEDADLAAGILRDIRAIDAGFYELHGDSPNAPDGLTPDSIEDLRDLGWATVLRTRDRGGEDHRILHRMVDGHDQVLVVGFEPDQLIVVRLEGQLGSILYHTIRRDEDLVVVARNVHDD